MFTAYIMVTLMAVVANAFITTGDFMRAEFVLINSAKVACRNRG